MENMIKIEELAMRIDSSVQTINNWYKWKRDNPDNELASILPDYIQYGNRQTRFWKVEDIWKFIEFKTAIVHGRNGVMGQSRPNRKRGKNNVKKKSVRCE